MQKKLLAAAVLSAFAGAASAQSSSVTIYGTLQGDFQFRSATGADTSTTVTASSARTAGSFTGAPANQSTRSFSNPAGSNFGLRGSEDLGNGVSAWFQLELATTLGNPSGTPDGANHGNAATFRNSAVGLRSNSWGTVAIGAWDTPYNVMAIATGNVNGRIGNATTGQQANLLGATMFGNGAWSAQNETAACQANVGVSAATCFNGGTNFDRRQKQLLQWWSPNWSGFEARVAYAATGLADAVSASNRAAGSLKPSIWDLALTYTNGPLAVGYAHSRQDDLLAHSAASFTAFGAAAVGVSTAPAAANIAGGNGTAAWQITGNQVNGSKGTAHRLGGKYTFALGGGKSLGLGGLWESTKWTLNYAAAAAGDLTELKKNAWRLQANYATGNHFFAFDYTRANALTGNINGAGRSFEGSGTDAKSWQLAYNYMLSKRTSLTAYYTQVVNGTNATYSGIVFAGIATAAGADPKYYGLTVRHAF